MLNQLILYQNYSRNYRLIETRVKKLINFIQLSKFYELLHNNKNECKRLFMTIISEIKPKL